MADIDHALNAVARDRGERRRAGRRTTATPRRPTSTATGTATPRPGRGCGHGSPPTGTKEFSRAFHYRFRGFRPMVEAGFSTPHFLPWHMVEAAMVRRLAGVLVVLFAAGCQQAAEKPAASASPALSPGDRLLLATARVALPPDNIDPSTFPDIGSPDGKLMMQFCGQCHAVASPGSHSAVEWPVVVRRMWLRMEMLPDTFTSRCRQSATGCASSSYLTRTRWREPRQPCHPGRGQDAFIATCSRCHALPDPRAHTAPGLAGRLPADGRQHAADEGEPADPGPDGADPRLP